MAEMTVLLTNSSLHAAVQTAGLAALDGLPIPVILVLPTGRVVHMNAAASTLVRSNRALRITGETLVTQRSADAIRLSDAIARVAARGRIEYVQLLTRVGEPGLILSLKPAFAAQPRDVSAPSGRGMADPTLVMVFAADLRLPDWLPAGWTRTAFGFTPQSAELAESLASGNTINGFCEETGVTLGAARTRLKKLLASTGAHTQAALVVLLLRAAMVMTPVSAEI